jgi:hypothetical protein
MQISAAKCRMVLIKSGKHPEITVTPSEAVLTASRPETFRLPKSGGDPFFGFSRSFYYAGEQRGYWRLIRLRERGKLRGVTLVPFDQVAAFVRKQMEVAG